MNKKWISLLTAFAICVTSSARTEEVDEFNPEQEQEFIAADEQNSEEIEEDQVEEEDRDIIEDNDEPVVAGKPVSREKETSDPAKRRRWQNIGIAAGAIAVAVTALVLVGQHDGHH